MEEFYAEGVAIHGGPESCVDDPRGGGEALTFPKPTRQRRLLISDLQTSNHPREGALFHVTRPGTDPQVLIIAPSTSTLSRRRHAWHLDKFSAAADRNIHAHRLIA